MFFLIIPLFMVPLHNTRTLTKTMTKKKKNKDALGPETPFDLDKHASCVLAMSLVSCNPQLYQTIPTSKGNSQIILFF